jgi:hypothetical protein
MALASPASPESAPVGDIVEHPDNAFSRSDARDDRSLYWRDASTLSETNMVFASIWSQSCVSNHGCCNIGTKGFFPTRIVHIRGPGDLVLEDGGDVCGRYLTLSYEWGQTKKYLTSTENVANHYASIPFGALPKTLLDAVHVTYRLGFRYLWIDALCIIHDSPEDLQKEISQMGSIYEASTITVFAEAGDDADAGLSVSRDPHSSKLCKLDLTATLEGSTLAVSTYACYDPDPLVNQPSESPLYRRGSVLQEEVDVATVLALQHTLHLMIFLQPNLTDYALVMIADMINLAAVLAIAAAEVARELRAWHLCTSTANEATGMNRNPHEDCQPHWRRLQNV